MKELDTLFFELTRVAIGTQERLSHLPSTREWDELFMMAKKQSLVGICFAGLQRLGADADEGFARIGMSEMLYLTWMGMAAKILQMNQAVDEQCVKLQASFSADGLRSSIMKGQGVGQLYTSTSSAQTQFDLRGLRQSGDIDIYVDCGMEKALAYAREKYGDVDYDYINAHVPVYEETEVELHWRVQVIKNLWQNRKFQKWTKLHEDEIFGGKTEIPNVGEIVNPSIEFNAFYILLHCFHHMFDEGLGLRQLMDYYFVLKSLSTSTNSALSKYPLKGEIYKNINLRIKQFGMMKFARSVMWIMREVFGMDEQYLVCEPDEKGGRFILKQVMMGGNFGHHDERTFKSSNKKLNALIGSTQHNWHLFMQYPDKVFWAPTWLLWHFVWKRTVGNI